jgi:hypothetical protein
VGDTNANIAGCGIGCGIIGIIWNERSGGIDRVSVRLDQSEHELGRLDLQDEHKMGLCFRTKICEPLLNVLLTGGTIISSQWPNYNTEIHD